MTHAGHIVAVNEASCNWFATIAACTRDLVKFERPIGKVVAGRRVHLWEGAQRQGWSQAAARSRARGTAGSACLPGPVLHIGDSRGLVACGVLGHNAG